MVHIGRTHVSHYKREIKDHTRQYLESPGSDIWSPGLKSHSQNKFLHVMSTEREFQQKKYLLWIKTLLTYQNEPETNGNGRHGITIPDRNAVFQFFSVCSPLCSAFGGHPMVNQTKLQRPLKWNAANCFYQIKKTRQRNILNLKSLTPPCKNPHSVVAGGGFGNEWSCCHDRSKLPLLPECKWRPTL